MKAQVPSPWRPIEEAPSGRVIRTRTMIRGYPCYRDLMLVDGHWINPKGCARIRENLPTRWLP